MFEFLRRDLLLILLMVAVFSCLSYAIGHLSKRTPSTNEIQTNFLGGEHTPRAQSHADRVWREASIQKALSLDATLLSTPTIMRSDHEGNIYVLDWADFRIKMFSPDGSLLKVFGQGKGTDTAAFLNPTSFSVSAKEELWVSDPPQRKITHFSPGGKVDLVPTHREAWRIASVRNKLITMAVPERNAAFEVYDAGEYSKSFGELLEDQSETGLVLDGNIVGDSDNQGFIYGGRLVGVIAGYTEEGKRRFAVQTIDRIPPPKIVTIGQGKKVKQNSPRAVLSMSILGNELYVLSGTRDYDATSSGRRVMDVYDKRNGDYLFSFKLPVACTEAIVRENYIYILGDGAVSVLRFNASTLTRS